MVDMGGVKTSVKDRIYKARAIIYVLSFHISEASGREKRLRMRESAKRELI